MEQQPVAAGHVRMTWTVAVTEEYTLTSSLADLASSGLEPGSLTAAKLEPGSQIDRWLADREGSEIGTDADYLCVDDRQLTDVEWPSGEEPGEQLGVRAAVPEDSGGHEPDATRVDLTQRLTLDKARARNWLTAAVTANQADLAAMPACEQESCGREQLADITGSWQPGVVGEEDIIRQLVTLADQHGIIRSPYGMEVEFRQSDDTYGAYYWFQLGVGPEVELASPVRELRNLCDVSLTGTEAALNILEQAVTTANEMLDGLARLVSPAAGRRNPAQARP
jgi:hypothetical protein